MTAGVVVQVVTTGTDWPAVVTTGAVGVVGIAAAYLQGRRSLRAQSADIRFTAQAEATRVALAEKGAVYAQCHAQLYTLRQEALRARVASPEAMPGATGSPDGDTYREAHRRASEAVWLVALRGSPAVGRLALQVLAAADAAGDDPAQDEAFLTAQAGLLAAMRTELDSAQPDGPAEPVSAAGAADGRPDDRSAPDGMNPAAAKPLSAE